MAIGQLDIRVSPDGIAFPVKVVTRAHRDEIIHANGQRELVIRLKAPPVEGRANEALVRFLAAKFGIHRNDVEIIRGLSSRSKIVRLRGVSYASFQALLLRD